MEGIVASKGKVVVVMGATATGKSKLAVDLALCLGGEVVNSDKIQVHDGFDLSHQQGHVEGALQRAAPPHRRCVLRRGLRRRQLLAPRCARQSSRGATSGSLVYIH
jgi:hypothetical protein